MSETTSELAVHMAAAAHQANAAALTDSAQFMAGVEQLGPDTPGFIARVSEAVANAVVADRERFGTGQAAPADLAPQQPVSPASRRVQLTADYEGEITAEDVRLAAPSTVNAWATSGRLAHLGVAAKQRRGR